MKAAWIFCIVMVTLLTANDSTVAEWKILEREVSFKPFSQQVIDSLKKEHTTTRNNKAPAAACKLPSYDKAVYRLKYGPINVGYGVLENDRTSKTQIYNIGKAMTSGLVAHFLKVRDLIWSFGDANSLTPTFFQESMFEQGLEDKPYIREKWTVYDNDSAKAVKWTGKKLEVKESRSFTNNYLSLLYNIRNSKIVVGDTLALPCFVHGKNYVIKTPVLKKEKISVQAGEFECFKLQPILVGEGHGFNKNDKMYLWIDVNYPHLLVYAKAEARLGKVRARLVHYEHYND